MSRDDMLVRAAQLRASIVAVFGQIAGPVTTSELLAKLALPMTMPNRNRVQATARGLVDSGVLYMTKSNNKNSYYTSKPEVDEQEKAVPKATAKAKATAGNKDVEIVIAGVLIVVGKNPATGRLRISLEEV